MNIQIFGSSKSFDTKKAERWFKERRIKYQYIDVPSKGLSLREYQSVKQKVGFEALVNRPQRKRSNRGLLSGYLGKMGVIPRHHTISRKGGCQTCPFLKTPFCASVF